MPLKSGEEVDVIAGPIGFDDQCAPSKPVCPPSLGEHSDEVLSSIGISADDLARMRTANIIG